MSWPPAPRVSPSLAVAAGALLAVAVVQVVVGVAALPVAAYLVIGDLSDHSDEWDGLAAFIGALVGGVTLVLVGVGALVLRLLRRNPVAAGAIVTALGGLLLLQGVHQSAAFGVGGADLWFVLMGLALALPGVAVIVASRTH